MDDLISVIENNTTPVTFINIKDAIETLDNLNVIDHLIDLESILNQYFSGIITNIELVDEVRKNLINTITSVCKEFGLVLVSDVGLADLVDIIQPLSELEFFDDFNWFIKILNSDSENRCKLISLLCNIKSMSYEHMYYENIESVSPALFTRLSEIMFRSNDDDVNLVNGDKEKLLLLGNYRDVLVKYLEFNNRYKEVTIKDYVVENIVRLGIPLGLKIGNYIFDDLILSEYLSSENFSISTLLNSKNPLTIAINIIGIAIISDSESKSYRDIINDVIEDIVHDSLLLVKTQVEISELINRFNKHVEVTNNVKA